MHRLSLRACSSMRSNVRLAHLAKVLDEEWRVIALEAIPLLPKNGVPTTIVVLMVAAKWM